MKLGFRPWQRLGTRVMLGFVAGTFFAALCFDMLLVGLTAGWMERELDYRIMAHARFVSREVTTALVIGDRGHIGVEVERALREADVVGIEILGAGGEPIESKARKASVWKGRTWAAPKRWASESVEREPTTGKDLWVYVTPIVRVSRADGFGEVDWTDEGRREAPGEGTGEAQLLGWLRVAASRDRISSTLVTVQRYGLLLFGVALVVGLLIGERIRRSVVTPLREADQLARSIAGGRLDQRIPVSSDDELGRLAESMNTMAAAVAESRRRAQTESEALRDVAQAMVAVAQGARASHDPASIFQLMAPQVRRVTQCKGVALAVARPDSQLLHFERFDPPLPWGGLESGLTLDPDMSQRFRDGSATLVRLGLLSPLDDLSRRLSRGGLRSAVLVSLSIAGAPPAVLLVVSDRSEGLEASDVQTVIGLASHLASSLHAQQLNLKLRHSFDELASMRNQLVHAAKMKAMGELAAGVAHDFNNVLGAILGRVQLLQRRLAKSPSPDRDAQASLEVIETVVRDGADTVKRLRQFSIGDESDGGGPVDVSAAIRMAIEYMGPRLEELAAEGRRVTVSFETAEVATVKSNAGLLRQVFTNLLLNAFEAVPDGGKVTLSVRKTGDEVAAAVEDNGAGMPPSVVERVFEPFFTTRGTRGSGLGLAVVYGAMRRMGGRIEVQSEPGRGTRFDLRWPAVAPAGAVTAARRSKPAETDPRATRVLVVDDEDHVRSLLVEIVESCGARTVSCGSAEEALDRFRPGEFDLVLTDLGLPGLNGWELVQAIRARDKRVMVGLVTGWADDVDLAAKEAAGVDAVIPKPFALKDVADVIQKAGEERRRAA